MFVVGSRNTTMRGLDNYWTIYWLLNRFCNFCPSPDVLLYITFFLKIKFFWVFIYWCYHFVCVWFRNFHPNFSNNWVFQRVLSCRFIYLYASSKNPWWDKLKEIYDSISRKFWIRRRVHCKHYSWQEYFWNIRL